MTTEKSKCEQCKGTGWYQYSTRGTPHSKVCEKCCNHEGTPWKHESGKFYCLKGCGEEMPDPYTPVPAQCRECQFEDGKHSQECSRYVEPKNPVRKEKSKCCGAKISTGFCTKCLDRAKPLTPVPAREGKPRCVNSPHCSHNTNGRDLSLPCSIELNPPSEKQEAEGWGSEMRKKFRPKEGDIFGWSSQDMGGLEMVIDFVRQTRKEAYQEGLEKGRYEQLEAERNTNEHFVAEAVEAERKRIIELVKTLRVEKPHRKEEENIYEIKKALVFEVKEAILSALSTPSENEK